MTDADPDASTEGTDPEQLETNVERSFTCTVCGFATTHEAGTLQPQVQTTCVNCGDWTVQTAPLDALVEAARDVAGWLSGTVITERQALAYLLREVVGVARQDAADAMDTTPSNLDNLHRRGREKVSDAQRIVEGLCSFQAGTNGDTE